MQEHNPKQLSGGSHGIRAGVWFIVCGLMLACVLLVTISRRRATPPTVDSASRGDAPRQALHGTGRSGRPVYRVSSATPETDAQAASTRPSVAISNELTRAREKLTRLRDNYSDQHPDVKGQLRAVERLERSAVTPGETLELAQARADLARLEVRFGSQHPELQAQQAAVQSLEQSAAGGEAPDLAEAKAQLARLRVNYVDQHPAVQSQLKKIAELQR